MRVWGFLNVRMIDVRMCGLGMVCMPGATGLRPVLTCVALTGKKTVSAGHRPA